MRKRSYLGSLSIEKVLPLLREEKTLVVIEHLGKKYQVKVGGKFKFKLFIKGELSCKLCGRIGTHFRIEQDHGHGRPHLDLFSEDEIPLTVDHIKPIAKGGEDHIDNMQILCEICNAKKGDTYGVDY